MNNLEDITRVDYMGNTESSVLHAQYDEESNRYVYVRGDYVRTFSPDFVVRSQTFVALRGGEIVEFEINDTIDCVEMIGEEVVLSDEDLICRVRSIKESTKPQFDDAWYDFISDYYDWDFIQFVKRNRPNLMI